MNAHAPQRPVDSAVPVARAEHISIEAVADADAAPAFAAPRRRKTLKRYELRSRLRGCETSIALLEDHYAAVRLVRPRSPEIKYEIDLRFVNSKPVLNRQIAWYWLSLSIALAALAGAALWRQPPTSWQSWLDPVVATAVATLLAALAAGIKFARATSEALQFVSVHGEVSLLGLVGGIGSTRRGKSFLVELIRSVNAAKLARPQAKAQFLRDEMREHHRLREAGVLSEPEYQAAKRRILLAH